MASYPLLFGVNWVEIKVYVYSRSSVVAAFHWGKWEKALVTNRLAYYEHLLPLSR